jgi:RNA polymerase sigma-70 factor, ECF subfamily
MLSFESLYRQFASQVFRFALWLCGDRAEAQDVTAETFVRAWAGVDEARTASTKAYLFTIARNLVHQRRRIASRQVELGENLRAELVGADTKIEAANELHRVLAALERLPEAAREALILRVDQELSYEDIATLLEISVASAKVLVHRARLKLALAREVPEPEAEPITRAVKGERRP